jgi:hypothetical protein
MFDGAGYFDLDGRQRKMFPWLAGGSAVVVVLGLCVFQVVRRK